MRNNPRKRRDGKIPQDVIIYVDHSMNIAKQIDIALKKLGKDRSFLADQLCKSESEISKWMSGTHNFTLKTISKIEAILNYEIIKTNK